MQPITQNKTSVVISFSVGVIVRRYLLLVLLLLVAAVGVSVFILREVKISKEVGDWSEKYADEFEAYFYGPNSDERRAHNFKAGVLRYQELLDQGLVSPQSMYSLSLDIDSADWIASIDFNAGMRSASNSRQRTSLINLEKPQPEFSRYLARKRRQVRSQISLFKSTVTR